MWACLNLRLGLAILIPLGFSWLALWSLTLVTSVALSTVTALTELIISLFKLFAYIFLAGLILLSLNLFSHSK
jgi:hypothetical protein